MLGSFGFKLSDIGYDILQDNEGKYEQAKGGNIYDVMLGKFQIHGDLTRLFHRAGINPHAPGNNGIVDDRQPGSRYSIFCGLRRFF